MNIPEKTVHPFPSRPRRLRRAAVALTAATSVFLLAACDDDASRSAPGVVPPSVAPTGVVPDAPSVDAPSKASREDGARDVVGEGGSKASPGGEDSDDPQTGWPGDGLVRGLGPAGHDAR